MLADPLVAILDKATADRIVTLDAGYVVEIGTHSELTASNGPCSQLWTAWSEAQETAG